MSDNPLLVRSTEEGRAEVRAVFGESRFGYRAFATASLPERVFSALDPGHRPPSVLYDEPAIDAQVVPTPLEVLCAGSHQLRVPWTTETRRSAARLESLWLLVEDRYRLLDTAAVEPLAHQAALVEHIVGSQDLERVLIADEVGLGKTIEAGLVIGRLQQSTPGLRVLYLTEAGLVDNVVEEFERLELRPAARRWTADFPEARLTPNDSDPLVVASIHRAAVNRVLVEQSGPWDVLIVDEAHHLTDYSPEGDDPKVRMRLVRGIVDNRMRPGGRVILLTGTPHQGHRERFKNVLRLLSRDSDEQDAAGRVIYRTKEDIRGWDGEPLFPIRRINEPLTVRIAPAYEQWMQNVHELLAPAPGASRASAWRRAQALQWCASSPQAGLAYLVRLALRAGREPAASPILNRALAGLRPYRGGSVNEPLVSLRERILRTRRQLEEQVDEVFSGGEELLDRCLALGAELLERDAFADKLRILFELLGQAPDEKFVVFAQPIETVFALHDRIERELGPGTTAMIVGDQEPAARRGQIEAFVKNPAIRVLVSSRSGGEGINLQVARRLVHFDVPWNPMEMEQRVGRVHRYGGARTVIVDTLVLEGSRERDVLRRARARLGRIAQDLDRERFEQIFGRTMSLIPYDELAALMAGEGFGPLTPDEGERLDGLVRAGYESLQVTEREFREHSLRVRSVDRGEVRETDLEDWLGRLGGGIAQRGWRSIRLREGTTGEPERVEQEAQVWQLLDGEFGVVGSAGNVGLIAPDGRSPRVQRVGLNSKPVARRLLELIAGQEEASGAGAILAHVEEWKAVVTEIGLPAAFVSGAILLVFVKRSVQGGAAPRELAASLHSWCVTPDASDIKPLTPAGLARMMSLLTRPRPKHKPPAFPHPEALTQLERRLASELGEMTPGGPIEAVFPVAAVYFEPTAERRPADGTPPHEEPPVTSGGVLS